MKKGTMNKILAIVINLQLIFAQNVNIIANLSEVNSYTTEKSENDATKLLKSNMYQKMQDEKNGTSTTSTEVKNLNSSIELNIVLDRNSGKPDIKDLKDIDDIQNGTDNNYLTNEEFVYNLKNNANFSNEIKKNIYGKHRNITYKAQITTGNINHSFDDKLSVKLGSKSKSMLLEETYSASNGFSKNIILKAPTYKCKSKEYSLMEKVIINPNTKDEYYMDVVISYKTLTNGTKQITTMSDIKGTKYTPLLKSGKNYLVTSNRSFVKPYSYVEASQHCVRLINNIKSPTCSTGFSLNPNGVCEKKFTNQPSPRKTTGTYYTCKNKLGTDSKGAPVIGVSIALNKNLSEEMVESCDNIPTTNDRMYYTNFGNPICENIFEDNSTNTTLSKFRYITNETNVKNYNNSTCIWNTIGNYKVIKDTTLSHNQLYSIIAQDKAVIVPQLEFLEKGHTYAFVLLSSGTAVLDPADGLKRTSTYSTDTKTKLSLKYNGKSYTALANVNSNAIANGYDYIRYEDMANIDKVYNDYNEIYAAYKKSINLGSLEKNEVYELNTKTNTTASIGKGYIDDSNNQIYINAHYEKKEQGMVWVAGAYYKKKTALINGYIYEVNSNGSVVNSNVVYVMKNADIESKIESDTSFTKIVLQDTFTYNGKALTLIPKPSQSWAYKLYIYDVNEYKKVIEHIKTNLYPGNATISKLKFVDSSNKSSYPYKKEFTDAVCSNADLGAKVYKKCAVRTTLFKTNLNSIKPTLNAHTCYTYFSYDRNNNTISTIIDKLQSKSELINNLNNKEKELFEDGKLNDEFAFLLSDISTSQSNLQLANAQMYNDLKTFYNIKTEEGKKELKEVSDLLILLGEDFKSILKEGNILNNKLSYLTDSAPVTNADALNLIVKLENNKLSDYSNYVIHLNSFLDDINALIKKYEYQDEYLDAYSDFLNIYIKDVINKLNKDFEIKVDKYNVLIEENKFFVEDVFAYTYKDKSGIAYRRLLSGDIIPIGNITLDSTLTSVAYKPACKLNGQLISCEDEIIKSKNICKTSESGKRTFCPSGTTSIGNEKCAQENCSIGYSFRTFTFNKQTFSGCIKEETGNFGCNKDLVKDPKTGVSTKIDYSLKYFLENGKNNLKCSSSPIFPKFSISNLNVSTTLASNFKFDGHTTPQSITVDSMSHEYNSTLDTFDLKILKGTLNYSGGNVKYKWEPGYLQTYGADRLWWYSSSYDGIQPNGINICHSCGWAGSSDAHHGSDFKTYYNAVNLFNDISSSSNLSLTFDCNGIMNNGKIEMYPSIGTNNVYTPTTKIQDLNIKSIPASKLPVWCVNIKPLDGCSNNDVEIDDCLIIDNKVTLQNPNDKYCYLVRPKLKTSSEYPTSCKSALFEFKQPVEAKCDLYNGFIEDAAGNCSRITYSKAIKNKDYYCSIVPDRFNPFDGGQAAFTIEGLKDLANDTKGTLANATSINFDIAIKKVSISAPVNYKLNSKVFSLINDRYVREYKSKSTKYYWNIDNISKINRNNAMYIPKINIHEYSKEGNYTVFKYVNDDKTPGKYNGFLLNKELNKSFNFNSIDEKAMYQKNIFNVHLEDEIYENYSVNMDKRFGLIKNSYEDFTPSSLGNKYKCLYDYSIFQLPDCNKGISNNQKQPYNLSYNNKIQGYVCSVTADINCSQNGGSYDKLLKKCVINTASTCPEEMTKNGKTYRKSLGEIKQFKAKDGSISCKLKKLKCDELSIEGKCPTGFEYIPNKISSIDKSCVLKSGIKNIIDTKNAFSKEITLKTVEVCPINKINSFLESTLGASTVADTKWRINSNNKCERNNYVNYGTDTLHLQYYLSPVLNISNELHNYNILSSITYRNNETDKTAQNLYNMGYKVNKNYLSIPIVVVPTTSNEEVIFSLTGFGKPVSVKTLNTGEYIKYDEIKNNLGVDIIKGFNDTPTTIINQKLKKGVARIALYTWDMSKIKKGSKLNYFCENAICGIVPVSNQQDSTGKAINVFNELKTTTKANNYLNNTIYNKCNYSEYPYQKSIYVNGKLKTKACFNIEETDLIKTKDITFNSKIVNDFFTVGKITRNGLSEDTIYADVNFDYSKNINYLCDYNSGWSLIKKNYKFSKNSRKDTQYYVCQKDQDATVDNKTVTITLVKDINTINTYSSQKNTDTGKDEIVVLKTNVPLKANFNNVTDNLCYYGLFNNEKKTSTDSILINNYGVFGSNSSGSSSGTTTNITGVYQNIGTNNFIMNFEEQNIYSVNNTKIKLKTGQDNVYNKPFYCVDADPLMNKMNSVGILSYSDLFITKKIGLDAISSFKLIAEYDNTVDSNKLISYSFPKYISNIIIKEKNNKRPQLTNFVYSHYEPTSGTKTVAEINSFNSQTNNVNLLLYDKTLNQGGVRVVKNNINGTPSLINIAKIKRDREMCFVFDLKYMNDMYDNAKKQMKADFDINTHNKQKVNKFYMVAPTSCEDYIQPYDKTKMAAAIIANPYLKSEFQKIQLMEQSDFKPSLNTQEVIDKTQRCIVKIKCMSGYTYDSANETCKISTKYLANKYSYKEDYLVISGNVEKIVTLQIDDVNKTFENLTKVLNAKKIPNSLREELVCDDGKKPNIGNTCIETKVVPAECKIPYYSNGKYLDYKIYPNKSVFKSNLPSDSYYCSFFKPYNVMHITTVMPKIEIK